MTSELPGTPDFVGISSVMTFDMLRLQTMMLAVVFVPEAAAVKEDVESNDSTTFRNLSYRFAYVSINRWI